MTPFLWALRDILSGKRAVGLLALAAVPTVLVGFLVLAGNADAATSEDATGILTTLILPVLVGLIALVASGPVLRTPLREATLIYQLTRPIPRASLGLQRGLAASVVTAGLAGASVLPVAGLLGEAGLLLGALPGLVLAGLAFGALYGFVVSLHRYALGVAVVHLVAETALAHVPFRVHAWTITWHAYGVLGQAADVGARIGTVPDGGGAWWVPAAILVLSLAATAALFRHRPFSLNVTEG